jgi:hypothetical protein
MFEVLKQQATHPKIMNSRNKRNEASPFRSHRVFVSEVSSIEALLPNIWRWTLLLVAMMVVEES